MVVQSISIVDYKAMNHITCEMMMWIKSFLEDLSFNIKEPIDHAL